MIYVLLDILRFDVVCIWCLVLYLFVCCVVKRLVAIVICWFILLFFVVLLLFWFPMI